MMNSANLNKRCLRGFRHAVRWIAVGAALFLLLMAPGAPAASPPVAKSGGKSATNGPSPQDMAYYKSIYELNIFDPTRIGPTPEYKGPPAPKVDAFALVGVMSYEKGQFAFFDGTSSEYKKALKVGDKVGDFTITEITDKQVKLKSADKEWELPLSTQLRREDKGEWKQLAMTGSFTASVDSGGSSGRRSFSSTDSSGRNSNRTSSGADFGGRRSRGGFGQDGASQGAAATDPSSSAPGIMSNAAGDPAASKPASDNNSSSNDGLTVLERLKKKREQEQKQ